MLSGGLKSGKRQEIVSIQVDAILSQCFVGSAIFDATYASSGIVARDTPLERRYAAAIARMN